jgi:putative oxidoreductase
MSIFRRITDTALHQPQTDIALLILRVGVGLLILQHGYPKFVDAMAGHYEGFPDPVGLGPHLSLMLAALTEFMLPLLLILGWYTRIALFPMLIGMLVIIFGVHGSDPISDKEHGILYLIPYMTLFLTGPGKFSFDGGIGK